MIEPADLPPLPVAVARRAVESLGGKLERGPGGDVWITSDSGREYGPLYAYRDHVTPGQIFEACRECKWDPFAIYAAARNLPPQEI